MEKKKVGLVLVAIAVVFYLSGFMIFYFGDVSVSSAVEVISDFFALVFGKGISFNHVLYFTIGLVFITLGLASLCVAGLHNNDWRIGTFALIPSLIGLVIFRFSLVFLFLALGVILFSIRNVVMSSAIYQELKKFNNYRVGSNMVGKAFVWITLFTSLGLFVTVTSSQIYEDRFQTNFKILVLNVTRENVMSECLKTASEKECQVLVEQIDEKTLDIGSLPIMAQIGQFLPLLVVLFFIGFMSILKLFLSIIAGLTTLFLIKIYGSITTS